MYYKKATPKSDYRHRPESALGTHTVWEGRHRSKGANCVSLGFFFF